MYKIILALELAARLTIIKRRMIMSIFYVFDVSDSNTVQNLNSTKTL